MGSMVANVGAPARGSGPSASHRLSLPAEVARRGAALLREQFWLWGQDIRRPEGNALLLHGFARQRPPAEIRGSSCYTLRLSGDLTVVLWGFGLMVVDRAAGGLYLSRFRLIPLLTSGGVPDGVWEPSQLPPSREPATADEWDLARRLLVTALRWIGAYERWILATLGLDYRRRCRSAATVCRAEDLATLWLRLAERCDGSLTRGIARQGDGEGTWPGWTNERTTIPRTSSATTD